MIVADLYFDGELVASGITPGWESDTPVTLDIGNGLTAHFGHRRLYEVDGVGYFEWTDNTNTRAGRAQNAGVVTKRILAEYLDGRDVPMLGNYATGPWGVVVTSIE